MTRRRPRPSRRAPRGTAVLAAVLLLAAGCATAREAAPVGAEVLAARALLEERWQAFRDLRALAELDIRQGRRAQRITGALLLRAPASLRFEALSPIGLPFLLVGSSPDAVTIWEVARNRAYLLPADPDASRRWLGVALGPEDLVALLSGHVRPLDRVERGALLPSDETGPSLSLSGPRGTQRIWTDGTTGLPLRLEWTDVKEPFRVAFTRDAGGVATGFTLATLDGRQQVQARYRRPAVNTGVDAGLVSVTVPQGVEIQDFR